MTENRLYLTEMVQHTVYLLNSKQKRESGYGMVRDPEGTKKAVLDAAEVLFAESGFDAVSLAEVGEAAGVSRGTPSYFFGSKKGLYRAVVERMVEDVRDFIAGTQSRPVSGERGNDVEEAIVVAIGAYVDFLAARPNFVRMIEREALDAGHLSVGEPGLATLSEALGDPGAGFLAEGLRRGPFRGDLDARQLVISIIALCFFPFAHVEGLLKRQLGLDPYDPTFIAERKRHVADLVMRGILAPGQGGEE